MVVDPCHRTFSFSNNVVSERLRCIACITFITSRYFASSCFATGVKAAGCATTASSGSVATAVAVTAAESLARFSEAGRPLAVNHVVVVLAVGF